MPLVKCPMCEKMISPNAESCPNCGEPMKKKEIGVDENKFHLILENTGNQSIKIIRRIREVTECGLAEAKDSIDNTPSIIVKNISYSKAEEIKASFESLGAKVQIISAYNTQMINNITNKISTKNKVLCPNCKSEKVHKISGLNKAGSAVLFGVFSLGKLNKTYECDDCGYRW